MTRSALATPMMRQYLELKARHPGAFLFYRMGDFYELFLDDAQRAAPLLDIALTTRDRGKPDAVPMCGVPAHSIDVHVKRLAALGHRIAICEQVEDARSVSGRRLVRREVVEVVTPGLVGDPEGLDSAQEVALVALLPPAANGDGDVAWGLAALEASTGDFRATSIEADGQPSLPDAVVAELGRIAPRECLLPRDASEEIARRLHAELPEASVTRVDVDDFDPAAAPARPDGFDAAARDAATRAAAGLLGYLGTQQPFVLRRTSRLRRYALGDAMVVDAATRTHLELFESAEDRSRRGTLLERLDAAVTPPGIRRLARWIAYPLRCAGQIAARQDAVGWLVEHDRSRGRLRAALRDVRDLERLVSKVARPTATPRDLVALRRSLEALPAVAVSLAPDGEDSLPGVAAPPPPGLRVPRPVPEAVRLVAEALVDEPPILLRGSRGAGETGFIREGHRPELDALREGARKGREWIAGLEARERERTGITSLKVRFHPVHGYGIEVTRAQQGRVPPEYERKQTLASAERFTTPELREVERTLLGANERAAALEREIFESVRQAAVEMAAEITAASDAAAELDALASLAEIARQGGWVRPVVDESDGIDIRGGRHPVIEPLLARDGLGFVPNDTDLDRDGSQILLLTGPNMSGKSTYLRQVALLVLLAHVGSFVPAESARIGEVDRIFTRVGAADRLARGESTFMVEMRECAQILSQASPRSLVILDELGRGTSTFDGVSIAWAVAEYLHDTPGLRPRTLFATHYHELTELAQTRARIRNAHFEVRSHREDVIFLRRMVAGGASRSYGIQVARMAGLPERVVARARELLRELEGQAGEPGRARDAGGGAQLGLFSTSPAPSGPSAQEAEALRSLRAIDPGRTTPLEALCELHRLVSLLAEQGPA
ncbi:MAG: DNA mismatch repair protein MutS [Deltaproteobacteria bacterium]|nr:DNA mismatch repair protein MutS [Deltaproteobacteria bacterium]